METSVPRDSPVPHATTGWPRLSPFALTALRVALGVVMAVHGWMKLMDYDAWAGSVAGMGIPLPSIAAPLAIAGELAGGVGLILGLLTPIAAFGVLCVALTAIFTVHLENGLLAQDGGFEYPMLIAFAALFFVVRGAGPISVDRFVRAARRRSPRETDERHLPRRPHYA